MRYNFYHILMLIVVLASLATCKNKVKTEATSLGGNVYTNLKYAKGFEIQHFEEYIELRIKLPFPGASEKTSYKLFKTGLANNKNELKIPLESVVVTSTTHIPALELLGREDRIAGFPNTDYISSEKTRALINSGKIVELGNEENINTEMLLDLNPDALIGFTLNSNNKMFQTIEKFGIPVLLNGDWVEDTPLGRAEWIKFFGVLFDREKEADSIFSIIEESYLAAVEIAKQAKNRPTVLSGGLYRDIWNLPAGDSFEAQFMKDANLNYLWSETSGRGSLSLGIETVFEKGKEADIWISPSNYESLKDMKNANGLYEEFSAFKKKKIYSFINKKGDLDGIIYFEKAPSRPDLVLKDLIKIGHPNLLSKYSLTFFEVLE